MTCTEMCGNGAWMTGTAITRGRQRMAVHGWKGVAAWESSQGGLLVRPPQGLPFGVPRPRPARLRRRRRWVPCGLPPPGLTLNTFRANLSTAIQMFVAFLLFAAATVCFSLGFVYGRLSIIKYKLKEARRPEIPLGAQLVYYSRWQDRQLEKALTDPID